MQNKYNQIQLIILAASIFLIAACSGNPPAWWDPSGIYSRSVNTQTQPSQPDVTVSHPVEQEMPAEETFETTQSEYEELKLSPLAAEQTEETAADAQTTAQQLDQQTEN